MRRARGSPAAITPCHQAFFTILLVSLGLIGCDNSCVIIVSNPGGGIISGGTSNCSLNLGKGNVRPRITSSFTPAAGNERARIQHIFVTIQGIEANPNATADEQSPDWQELAPKLVTRPMQVDLLATSGHSDGLDTLEDVAVPADAYRQVRLRLAPNQPSNGNSVLQENSCGSLGLNCLMTSDGGVRALVLDNGLSQIQVSSDHITGGWFRIFPETTVKLKIEFNPQSSLFIRADEAVRFVPVFTVESQTPGESADSANQ
jgi:Domain of unknown function (DUF4382)